MILRKTQVAFLDQQQSSSFERRLIAFLQQEFEGAAREPAAALQPELAVQISNARKYDLLTEQSIASYVVTAWLLGPDFDVAFPAANEVLTAQIPGEMKAAFLEAWTTELFETLEAKA